MKIWKGMMVMAGGILVSGSVMAGDKATLADHQWVDLKNLSPIRSGNRTMGFGDTCGVYPGGEVVAVGDMPDGTILVRYSPPPGEVVAGALCAEGALFVMKREDFAASTARYEEKIRKEAEERAVVARVLGK